MKKNIAALVLAIIGAVLGVVGSLMWATCAETCAGVATAVGGGDGGFTIYLVLFIVLGIGGSVLSLVGGIRAYGYNGGRLVCSILGLLMQVGNLVVQCVFIGGIAFTLSVWTILAIVLCLIETIFAARKA